MIYDFTDITYRGLKNTTKYSINILPYLHLVYILLLQTDTVQLSSYIFYNYFGFFAFN